MTRILGALLLLITLSACGTYTGGVEVRTKGFPHYPVVVHHPVYVPRDIKIETKEDEQGLVSFRVSQSGLHEHEAQWILDRFDDLKTRCQGGGETKKYEIKSAERVNPYGQSRSVKGDISLRLEYVCTRAPKQSR